MRCVLKNLSFLLMTLFCLGGTFSALADVCAICGQPIYGQIYLVTDQTTGQKIEVCSNCCFHLPRCYLCGLPIKAGDELKLPDGRFLCARDAKSVVLNAADVRQICAGVKSDLDSLFARFTSFPNNVGVAVIDRIDAYSLFQSEAPNLLGCTQSAPDGNGGRNYKISLMTGLPPDELRETCAHEYGHTWVGENVSPERHARLAKDAEEGFCEMLGYLYMDSLHDETEKKRVLANNYTRGQVALFVRAEQQYGFNDVLDWMRYGVAPKLEAGHLDEIRNVQMPSENLSGNLSPSNSSQNLSAVKFVAKPAPTVLKLEGILWGNSPSAIINGKTFFAGDSGDVKLGATNLTIRCLEIQQKFVRVKNLSDDKEQRLELP